MLGWWGKWDSVVGHVLYTGRMEKKTKVLLVAVLPAILTVFIIFFLVMPQVREGRWSTFNNESESFLIKYPSSWYYEEFPPEEIGTSYKEYRPETKDYKRKFIDEVTNYEVAFGPTKSLISPLRGGGGYIRVEVFEETLDEYFELALERNIILNLKKNREKRPIEEIRNDFFGDDYTLNGIKGYTKTELRGIPGLPGGGSSSYEAITVLLQGKDRTYKITMHNTKNDPDVKITFERMLPTFTTL